MKNTLENDYNIQKNSNNTQGTFSWWSMIKIFVTVVVIGVVVPIIHVIIGWREENIQRQQMEIERQQAEWEQQQNENTLAPTIKVDKKGIVLLGKSDYRKYELYNSENNLAGGKLEKINGVVMVKCGEIRIKTLWIKDAIYDVEVPFDSEQQRAEIFFKEQDAIEEKAIFLKNEIEEYLQKQIGAGVYEYEIRIGIVATLEYSDSNNTMKMQKYIIYLEQEPYCEAIGDEEIHCDKYYLEYGEKEQGDEFTAVIYEAAKRIQKECREH